jgi:hypothetical protein
VRVSAADAKTTSKQVLFSQRVLTLLRKALPFLIVAILAAALYDSWVFYSRWRAAGETERKSEAKKAEEARRTIEMLGGGGLKTLSFYASPGAIRRGDRATICFGVYGAKSVRMEPPVEPLHPAVSYCFQVSPSRSTEYKLYAEDGSGHTATEGFVLTVAP